MFRFGLFLALFSLAFSRKFINPVIQDLDNPDPGVIADSGAWYGVTTTNGGKNVPKKFPIHKTTNLQNWTTIGHVFDDGIFPNWTNVDNVFWAPEIHRIGENFRVYYTSRNLKTGKLNIGVATAVDNHNLRHWQVNYAPVISDQKKDNWDASVTKDNKGDYYLVWTGNVHGTKDPSFPIDDRIWAQKLTADGLSVVGDRIGVMNVTLAWEKDTTEGPWIIKRKNYYYLFYSANNFCSDKYAVGVARALDALGPYEKKGDPILVSSANWKGPGHCSVVPDAPGEDVWAMVYHAFRADKVCGNPDLPYPRLLNVKTVKFDDNDWPYMSDN